MPSFQPHYFPRVLGIQLLKLSQCVFRFFRDHLGQGDLYLDELIASQTRVSQARKAALSQSEFLPGLGSRRRPVPSQSGQAPENWSRPPERITCPVPLHVGHCTTGPPVSPAPWQCEHCSDLLTVIFVVRPRNASSKLSASGISMSRPRF